MIGLHGLEGANSADPQPSDILLLLTYRIFMKVIFEFNGKSKELDSNDIKSDADLKKAILEVANSEEKDVTQVLDNVSKMEKLVKETAEVREHRRLEIEAEARHIQQLFKSFLENYNEYASFMQDNAIKFETQSYETPNEVLSKRREYEHNLSYSWQKIKMSGHHKIFLSDVPQLKPFCKAMEQVYKVFKKHKGE